MKGATRTALFLARRFQWRPEGRKRTSPSVSIAVSGTAIAFVIMMVSVAVVSGFKQEVKARLMGINDSITITAYDVNGEQTPLKQTEILELIGRLPDNATIEPHLQTAAIIKTADDFAAIGLQSSNVYVDPDSIGSISLSAITAKRLGLAKGDKAHTYFFIDNRLRVRPLCIDSVYASGIDEHDSATGYCSEKLIRRLTGLGDDMYTSIGIRGLEPEQATQIAEEIHGALLSAYYTGRTTQVFGISTIEHTDAVYFTWLDLLDTNVVVILALMAAVATFTLISSLFIIILERVKTIGLLKALDADNRLIRRTFMLMTERLVAKGLIIGNAVALLLIYVQNATHILPLDPANYYVDHVPVLFSISAWLMLNGAVLLFSWFILMLPALIIARISPASTMRYE